MQLIRLAGVCVCMCVRGKEQVANELVAKGKARTNDGGGGGASSDTLANTSENYVGTISCNFLHRQVGIASILCERRMLILGRRA